MSRNQTSALRDKLRAHAQVLEHVRRYFAAREVVEVDTCALAGYGATDPSVTNMRVRDEHDNELGYLQFSPEFAMKRLLSEGSGDIYQICRAYRGEECGRIHRPEFRILEWYRLGFDMRELMGEVQDLLDPLIAGVSWREMSYAELFKAHVGIDPHSTSSDSLFARASLSMELNEAAVDDRGLLFDIIFSHQIQPQLNAGDALFVYDFPREQAAYAQISDNPPHPAFRFELLVGSLEIANGYQEVLDPIEQAKRHAQERARRRSRGQIDIEFDPNFIAALERGVPPCSGVAVGLDRLLMVISQVDSLDSVEMR
ncbi:MAG: EF-P lysine aminoacylase EpmA [Gammaproteobacteria bacterium]